MARRLHMLFSCPEPWEGMSGTDRERHCARCDCAVEDLTTRSAEELQARLGELRPGQRACFRLRVQRSTGRALLAAGAAAVTLSSAACSVELLEPGHETKAATVHVQPPPPTADAGCEGGRCVVDDDTELLLGQIEVGN